MSFRTVVMPVAGLGTRFLPATKVVPKEMLPVVDRPLVQFAVDEALAAGLDDVVFVSSPSKGSLVEHFEAAPDLERTLRARDKEDLLAALMSTQRAHSVRVAIQEAPLGVGHAVLQARDLIQGEAFAVAFPDDFIVSDVPVLEQLRAAHRTYGGIILAVEPVPDDHVDRYGIAVGTEIADGILDVTGMVEKPAIGTAPTNLAIVGRYILPTSILDLLATTPSGVGGEIQLTDALVAALATTPCHAVVFEGTRYDCGNKLGYLQATVQVARRHPELGAQFEDFLRTLDV